MKKPKKLIYILKSHFMLFITMFGVEYGKTADPCH